MQLKLISVLMPMCLLGACALESKRIEPPQTRLIVQPAMPSESDQLLVYFAQVRKFDARELASEREQMRNAFQLGKSEFNRVKLAILLASTPTALLTTAAIANDDGELIGLLEPLVNGPSASTADPAAVAKRVEISALASLVYGMAQDRRKLREQWRETQARVNALRRDETKDVEARALRAQVDELERKLAALKSIDRSVNRRSESPRTESPK